MDAKTMVDYLRDGMMPGTMHWKAADLIEQLAAERDELQKRALTPDEVQLIRDVLDDIENERRFLVGGQTETDLRKLLSRISPPVVEWVDVGEVSVAQVGDITLRIEPRAMRKHDLHWTAWRDGVSRGWGVDSELDAAKATAVEWVRGYGAAK